MAPRNDDPKKREPVIKDTTQKPASGVMGSARRETEGQDCPIADIRERREQHVQLMAAIKTAMDAEIDDATGNITPEERAVFSHAYRLGSLSSYCRSLDEGPDTHLESDESVLRKISELDLSAYGPGLTDKLKDVLLQIAKRSPSPQIRDAASKKLFGLKSR